MNACEWIKFLGIDTFVDVWSFEVKRRVQATRVRSDSKLLPTLKCDLKSHDKCDVGSVKLCLSEAGAISSSNVSVPNVVIAHEGVSCACALKYSNNCQYKFFVTQKFSLLPL